MAAGLTNFWLKFFKEAGIQNTTSTAVYATTFAENEIQNDMIVDLTREILRELGITTMGHVLAILKHAKAVHSQTLNEKIVASTHPVVEPKTFVSPVKSPVKSSPMSRMIEHYVKSSEYETPPEEKSTSVKMRIGTRVVPKLAARLGEVVPKSPSCLKVTDRLGILTPSAPAVKRKSNMISLKPARLVEEVPVKRIRQVLPEEEGGYKITMPRGTTPKTKQILAKQSSQSKAPKGKTVFERLGESSVSSTTCVDEQQVTFTGMGTVTKAGGVFRRLGDKPEITSTITSEQCPEEPVGYFGVLKNPAVTNPTGARQSQLNNTMKTRLDGRLEFDSPEEKVVVKKSGLLSAQKVTFKPSAVSRLGMGTTESFVPQPETRVVKKKFIKTLANGKRVIVSRDVVEEVTPSPLPPVKKAVSFGESKFRSDFIAPKAAIASRLGDDEEWDY